MKKKILILFGTRPEAIKLAPLIRALKKENGFRITVCVTAQHRRMLDQVLSFFGIKPEIDLDIMIPDQTIEQLSANLLTHLAPVLKKVVPHLVIVQGDTTTAYLGALAAFYQKIPVAHVEAGLRTHDINAPFPEELNRQFISRIARYHFAPTETAVNNLLAENIKKGDVYKTGNTVVDAMNLGLRKITSGKSTQSKLENWFNISIDNKNITASTKSKIILITGHRRESFGAGFKNICRAIKELSSLFPMHLFVYPVHLNPNVQKPVYSMLGTCKNVALIEPVDYAHILFLMSKSYLILTDSGGIQEEAPSLKIPVLVMREKTERQEGITNGCCKLVGNNTDTIIKAAKKLLTSPKTYLSMQRGKNLYGDGKASERIVKVLKKI